MPSVLLLQSDLRHRNVRKCAYSKKENCVRVILTFVTLLAVLYVCVYHNLWNVVRLEDISTAGKQNKANGSYSNDNLTIIAFSNFSYVPTAKNTTNVSYSNDNWIIIAFTDFKYVPTAKRWYERLSSLGYTDHVIGTLDKIAYDQLKSSYRVHPITDRLNNITDIWKVRMEAIRNLLRTGRSVFVSDVDSIWLRQIPFRTLDKTYDAFYARGTIWPENVYKMWGFVLCCCVSGYRSNNKTIALLDKMLDKCYKRKYMNMCDDQLILNNVYATDYEIEWKGRVGYSQRHNFTVYAYNRQEMQRGVNITCDGLIISPYDPIKTNERRIAVWDKYTEKCNL